MITEFEIDLWQWVTEDSINVIQNSEIANDQVEEISDEWSNVENDKLEQESMGFIKIIKMLDKKKWCPVFDDVSQDMLPTITKMIEDLQLKNRKQIFN